MTRLGGFMVALAALWIIKDTEGAKTFRREAESLLGPHSLKRHQNASDGQAVRVNDVNMQLTFPMCFYTDVIADITVAYSSGGPHADNVTVKMDEITVGAFQTDADFDHGDPWNDFQVSSTIGVPIGKGLHRLMLDFPELHEGGIEIDYVEVTVYDDFMTEAVFNCTLVMADEPRFSDTQATGVENGYVVQHSYYVPCQEEDNVHIAAYHNNIRKYTLKASYPMYRTLRDEKMPEESHCVNLGITYWQFEQINASNINSSVDATLPAGNHNNATVIGENLANDTDFSTMFTISFDLKGFSTGFIDADVHSDLYINFTSVPSTGVSVKVVYRGRGDEVVLDTFNVAEDVGKKWTIPEMTWSEYVKNDLYIYASDDVILSDVKLDRGYLFGETKEFYRDDGVYILGTSMNFWWRRPAGESLTVEVENGPTVTDLAFIAIAVPFPWGGPTNWQQIFVIYQDGNVRLLTPPYGSPNPGHWNPFGSSVIVGKSDPSDLRPVASIRKLLFRPKTFQMTLTYYDGSSADLDLSYTHVDTTLTVSRLSFNATTSNLPFATFRSMFVEFGKSDSDSIQSNLEGPRNVLGTWSTMSGKEFKLFRAVESFHLTQSPDITLKIEA